MIYDYVHSRRKKQPVAFFPTVELDYPRYRLRQASDAKQALYVKAKAERKKVGLVCAERIGFIFFLYDPHDPDTIKEAVEKLEMEHFGRTLKHADEQRPVPHDGGDVS